MPKDRVADFIDGVVDVIDDVVDTTRDLIEDIGDLITGRDDEDEAPDAHVRYDYDNIPPVALRKGLSLDSLPSAEWFFQVGKVAVQIQREQKEDREDRDDDHPTVRLGRRLRRGDAPDVDEELRSGFANMGRQQHAAWFRGLVQAFSTRGLDGDAPATLADYEDLFEVLPLPAAARTFQEDASFANRRVAGPNPTSLERVRDALPSGFGLTETQFQSVLPDDTLAAAIQQGRAYVCDYGGRKPVIDGTHPDRQKYGYAPFLLLVSTTSGNLVPVAIQTGQDPAVDPIVLPSDGHAWMYAKTMVDIADANYHELVVHLGRTHLLVEPFTVATERQLEEHHPLRRLLDPHFEGTQFINWAAGDFLVAPRNVVDEILSGTIDADRTLAVQLTSERSFHDSYLPAWLAAQGLDDTEALPHHPFRDDALLLWNAIGRFVEAYVAIHWPDDGAVIADGPLQHWSQELRSFEGGRVAGFGDGPDGSILTTEYLVGALTMVIFTGSAMHAAVNFPQKTDMSFAPAMPLAGYRPSLQRGQTIDEHAWLELLPGLSQAATQRNILTLLGGIYHTTLGHYDERHFREPREQQAVAAFQKELQAIEATIQERNRTGLRAQFPYEHLLPSKIPQSINI